ncbi:MAG: hypothetical protein J7K68_03255 [Candidatus Diapherotrites archaeon]|nr:hypothetical protein [Candidatus Diapherotrites archaeon]
MLYDERSQGATEYLALLGGIILIILVVTLFIKSQTISGFRQEQNISQSVANKTM